MYVNNVVSKIAAQHAQSQTQNSSQNDQNERKKAIENFVAWHEIESYGSLCT